MARIGSILEAAKILNSNCAAPEDLCLDGSDLGCIFLPVDQEVELSDQDVDRLIELGAEGDGDDRTWSMSV